MRPQVGAIEASVAGWGTQGCNMLRAAECWGWQYGERKGGAAKASEAPGRRPRVTFSHSCKLLAFNGRQRRKFDGPGGEERDEEASRTRKDGKGGHRARSSLRGRAPHATGRATSQREQGRRVERGTRHGERWHQQLQKKLKPKTSRKNSTRLVQPFVHPNPSTACCWSDQRKGVNYGGWV